ncbi:MAG: hypothetical protein AAFQ02_09260 [Bacteroidota bacterium]
MPFLDFPIYDIPAPRVVDVVNQSGPIILVNSDDYTKSHQQFLSKIVAATKHQLDQLQVVTTKNGSETISLRSKDPSTRLILCFGMRSMHVSLNCDDRSYRLVEIDNLTYLFCNSLGEIQSDPGQKKALWSSLKQFYQL